MFRIFKLYFVLICFLCLIVVICFCIFIMFSFCIFTMCIIIFSSRILLCVYIVFYFCGPKARAHLGLFQDLFAGPTSGPCQPDPNGTRLSLSTTAFSAQLTQPAFTHEAHWPLLFLLFIAWSGSMHTSNSFTSPVQQPDASPALLFI